MADQQVPVEETTRLRQLMRQEQRLKDEEERKKREAEGSKLRDLMNYFRPPPPVREGVYTTGQRG